MTLAPGTRIAAYEITSAMGAGGMGEVYRARDTRLKRDVALKFLPAAVASDPDRVARFEREAELLAALNHPNIAGLYGIEEVSDTFALVMELVEGEDLSARIARGALPLDEALPIARQIADALEAAHERGIIHRDLKPANIKIRPDGTVKVLDFGLAKSGAASRAPGATGAGSGALGADAKVANSPTFTSPAMTAAGVILGTAAYMSPEQARGKQVDRRADIWALGAVLFEMLTGTRAFAGDDVTETLASVLRSEPAWTLLPAETPGEVRTLLEGCLQKDPRARLSHLSVATFLLTHGLPAPQPEAGQRQTARREVLAASLVTLLVGAALASIATWWVMGRAPAGAPPSPVRFTVAATTGGETWHITTDRPLALSPDGRTLAYRASDNGVPRLFVRRLDALEPQVVANSDLPRTPFFSPDSEWVAFFVGTELRKARVSGGPSITVTRASTVGGLLAGASWGDDDSIVFAIHQPNPAEAVAGLMIVPASGGEPQVLTTIDPQGGEGAHAYPFVLPGSRGVLFKVQVPGRAPAEGRLMVFDRASGQRRELASDASAGEYLDGHVVYADPAGRLHSLPFNLPRLEPTGPAMPLTEQVHVPSVGHPLFSTAASGAIAFISPADTGNPEHLRSLVWVDRDGRETSIAAPPRSYAVARLSPDGSQIALDVRDHDNDIWIWSTDRGAMTRLTRGPTLDMGPMWTPDGRRIIWSSSRESTNPLLFWQAADGTGTAERLTERGFAQFAGGVTPDGASVIFFQGGNPTSSSLRRLHLAGDRKVESILAAAGMLLTPEVSPDGRWLAYTSDESGRLEIYVRPYPNVDDGRWQVSSQGGTRPAWSRNGRELFFLDDDERLSVASITLNEGRLVLGAPRRLLERAYYPGFTTRGLMLRGYDVSADGQRFLMIKGNETAESESMLTVAINWSPIP